MAQRPTAKDIALRDTVRAAVTKLHEVGEPDLADAVDTLLTPNGWAVLGRLRSGEGGTNLPRNKSMWLEVALKQRVLAGAEAEGRDVVSIASEGLEKFLAGQFVPEQPARATRGSAPTKTSLTPRIPDDLWDSATAYGEAHAEELGWTPVASQVVVAYFAQLYPEPEPVE